MKKRQCFAIVLYLGCLAAACTDLASGTAHRGVDLFFIAASIVWLIITFSDIKDNRK